MTGAAGRGAAGADDDLDQGMTMTGMITGRATPRLRKRLAKLGRCLPSAATRTLGAAGCRCEV